MAYSPVAQGKLLTHRKLAAIAREAELTPAQLALAWVLARPQVIAIPQSSNLGHIDEIRGAAAIRLEPPSWRRSTLRFRRRTATRRCP